MADSSTEHLLKSLLISFNLLSLLSTSTVIFSYVFKISTRNFAYKLVVYLQIADLMLSISNILIVFDDISIEYCIFNSYIITASCNASIMWTLLIAFAVYQNVIQNNQSIFRYEKYFIIIGYLFPFIYTLIPIIYDGYGISGFWCSFKFDKNNMVKTILSFMFFQYGLVWLSMISICIIYSLVILTLKKRSLLLKGYVFSKKLFIFPIIFIICWIFQSINRIYNFAFPDDPLVILAALQIMGSGLIGFFNTMAYAINKRNIQKLKNIICKKYKKTKNENLIDSTLIVQNENLR